MNTIKRLIEKMTGNTTHNKEDEVQKNEPLIADYEKIIADLELLLEEERNSVKNLEKAIAHKDELLQKALEELKLANVKIEELKGVIRKFQSDTYGSSSEKEKNKKQKSSSSDESDKVKIPATSNNDATKDELAEKRKRGGQRGNKGHGRRIPDGNPDLEYHWDIPDENCKCKICGKKFRKISKFRRISHGIEIRIELIHTMHIQEVYEKECNCDDEMPQLIVAPKPTNIIYKSIFDTSTWCQMLAMKYLTCIPINRFNNLFAGNSYKISPSTVLGGFEEILKCMMPLYDEIVKENQKETYFHADETRWCRMLDPDENKIRLYWVWAFLGKRSVVYVTDPTRSKEVPKNHFKNTKEGFVNVDRYPSYNILTDKLILSYCWQHLKRDFINIGKKFTNLQKWANLWLDHIHKIEKLNNSRLESIKQNKEYVSVQTELEQKVNNLFKDASFETNMLGLKKEQLRILKGMIKRKDGYSVFVSHPEISMYNNAVEQEFRHVSNARNNYRGSVSKWGGTLAAVTWTIFRTALMNGLEPVSYLEMYLKAYSIKNSSPDDMQKLLPWNYKEFLDVQQSSG